MIQQIESLKVKKDQIHIVTKTKIDLLSRDKYHTRAIQRGKNSATMYFLVPRQLREHIESGQKFDCRRIKGGFIFIRK